MNIITNSTVDLNPWFLATVHLLWWIGLPGVAWGWRLPAWRKTEASGRAHLLMSTTRILVSGLLITLLVALVLIRAGLFTAPAHGIAVTAISVVGLVTGLRRHRDDFIACARQGLPGICVCAIGFIAIMWTPKCGEWIVGGWDPGIYINNGVVIAREGGDRFAPSAAFTALTYEELTLYTRIFDEKVYEVFPGVPIDPETREYRLYFFPLMSAWVALLELAGGLRAATRANLFAGWLQLLLIPALLLALTQRKAYAFFALPFLWMQPVWLYHLATPTSEMLQMLLLCGLLFLTPFRTESRSAVIMLGGLLLLSVVNRLGFLPFGALFVVVLAWLDAGRPERARVGREQAWYLACLFLGAWIDFVWATSTIGRLGDIVPTLLMASAGFAALAFAIHIAAHRAVVRAFLSRIDGLLRGAGAASILVVILLLWRGTHRFGLEISSQTFQGILPFFTPSLVLMGLLGFFLLAFDRRPGFRTLSWWTLFLASSVLFLLLQRHIAGLYPWATRRFVTELTLLLVIGAAYPVYRLWAWRGIPRWTARAAAILLCAVVLAPASKQAYRAASQTEYDGLSRVLNEVAQHIDPDDIVVADHFKWGTPLALIHGRQIINGERLWAIRDDERIEHGVEALRRMAAEGQRVRFLTSTERRLDVYRWPVEGAREDWRAEPFTHTEFIHHPRGSTFVLRTNQVVFTLYTWEGAAAAP